MMIVQHKVSVLASRTRHSSQRKGGLLGCARQYNGKVYMQCYDAGTAERAHTRTHADTHARTRALCGGNMATKSAHPSRGKRGGSSWRTGARVVALRPVAVRSRRRALPHEGLGWGALAWLVEGLLLLVEATAAAMAAAEERAGASRLRLKAPEGPGGGPAAGLGRTMSAAAENAAAVRNLLSEAAVVESVRGEPADTGASPAAGDMMVGTLYTVDRGNEPPPRPPSVLAYHELVLWYGER